MTLLVGKRSQSINYLLFSFRKSYPAQVKKIRKYPRRWHLTIVKCCLGYIRIFSNVPVDIYITSIFCNFLIETWFWSYPNSRGRCNFIIWFKNIRRPKMIFFSKTFTLLVASVWFGIKVMVNLNSSQIKRTLLFWELHFRCIIF